MHTCVHAHTHTLTHDYTHTHTHSHHHTHYDYTHTMGVLLTGPSIKGSSQVGSKKKPVRRHGPELHTNVCKGRAWQHSTQEKYCIPCHLILLACSEWTIGRKNDTTGRARGLGRKTREGDRNGEPNDNPETPDRGATRHPWPPFRVNTEVLISCSLRFFFM